MALGTGGFKITGENAIDLAGISVSSAGDVNGDGFDDLIVGAPRNDAGGSDAGAGYVVFGDNFTGAVTHLGTDGAEVLTGTAGADNINGAQGDDTLDGGASDDRMTGASGDDLFVFANGDGDDTVTDFVAGAGTDDRIDFSGHSAANNLADVTAAASQVGADTVIDLGGGDSVTLIGVDVADLHNDDFVF